MPLFGPKRVCAHCGREVRRHRDTADYLCPFCRQPGPWASLEQSEAFEAEQLARARYEEMLSAMSAGTIPARKSLLDEVSAAAGYAGEQLARMNEDAWASSVSAAVADDIVTAEEYARIEALTLALGLDWTEVSRTRAELADHVAVAAINGGLLPEVEPIVLIPKVGEIVRLEVQATLMKLVPIRQYQAGYQGFSFPIGKTGIRYRVGGVRGKSVVIGTEFQAADVGTLCVSSERAVFVGRAKTLELPYAKLVSLTVYGDAVQFHQSNRQTAPLFRVPKPDIVAALINALADPAGPRTQKS
jgi:hypothetical protein